MNTIIKAIATGFYLGHVPFAPGTFGSILGVLIFLQCGKFPGLYLIICFILIVLGFLVSGPAEKIYNQKDSQKIIIDEVCGMSLTYIGLGINLQIIITGFFLYRFFDILKPFPIKKMEKLPAGAGIMADDIVAAFYANITLRLISYFLFKNFTGI